MIVPYYIVKILIILYFNYAPVAQLDRATDF